MKRQGKLTGNALFFAVMKKTGGRCYYCGAKKWPARKPSNQPEITIDHFVPTARGGGHDFTNLVPACRACNSAKCAGTPDDFRHSAAQRILRMPGFSRAQIQWMRAQGFDLSAYDNFKFWFEAGQKQAHLPAETSNSAGTFNALQ